VALDVSPRDLTIQMSDLELIDNQIAVALACNRGRIVTKGKARKQMCLLFTALNLERIARDLPSPGPPWSSSDIA
jgi:hypothetical protein